LAASGLALQLPDLVAGTKDSVVYSLMIAFAVIMSEELVCSGLQGVLAKGRHA
jgi:hypothetical protein